MDKWINNEFESSCYTTDEFKAFAKDYKKAIKKALPPTFELVDYSRGHFYISGFVKCKVNNRFVYFSISDVRHFKNEWFNNVLIRTAKDIKDYTGGSNCYTTLKKFGDRVSMLVLT